MKERNSSWEAGLEIASISDIGMRRTSNQDNFCVCPASSPAHWEQRGHLFVVADGMGAHAAGELASKIAVDTIPHLFNKLQVLEAPAALQQALQETNAEIHRRGQANPDFHNMGTTCSCLLLCPDGAFAAHVGDSRVYRLRGTSFEQLTFDHSLVWEMRQQGSFGGDEAASARIPKNVITRSLGPYPEVRVDLEGPFDVQLGDIYLLCSDGLTGQIDDAELGAILHSMEPGDAAQVMVDLANLRGGPDNITLVIVRVDSQQLAVTPVKRNSQPGSGQEPMANGPDLVEPLLWGLLAILLASGLLIYIYTSSILSLAIMAGLSVVVLVLAIYRRNRPSGSLLVPPAATGKSAAEPGGGPYVKIDCRATAWKTVDHLKDLIQQIREAGNQKNWVVDENELRRRIARAEGVASAREIRATVREYSLTISWLMNELRGQNGDDSGD